MHAHNKLSSSLTFAHLKAIHKSSQLIDKEARSQTQLQATSDSRSEHGLLNSHFSTGQASPMDLCCHHLTEEANPPGWLCCGYCHRLRPAGRGSGPAQPWDTATPQGFPAQLPSSPFLPAAQLHRSPLWNLTQALPTATHWRNVPREVSQDTLQDWVLK